MKINNTNFYTHNHIELARPNKEDSLENLVGKKGFKEFMKESEQIEIAKEKYIPHTKNGIYELRAFRIYSNGIDFLKNTTTDKVEEFYRGKRCEDLIKNITPKIDSVTGVTYYPMGRDNYIPESQKDLFERRIKEIAKSQGFENDFGKCIEIGFSTDIYTKCTLPDGSEAKISINENKLTITDLKNKIIEKYFAHYNDMQKYINMLYFK